MNGTVLELLIANLIGQLHEELVGNGLEVRLLPGGHRDLGARMVLPLDDPVVTFDAASLRGS